MPKVISSFVILGMGLIVCLTSAFGSNGLIGKYKHRYTALEEADVDSVITLLSSPDSVVAGEAATLVGIAFEKGFASAQKALTILLGLVESDKSLHVRTLAAGALFRSGDERAVGPLWNIAKDDSSDPGLRVTALSGLSFIGAKTGEVAKVAAQNLHSADPGFRYESIKIVAKWGDKADWKKLLQAYIDHHERPDAYLKEMSPVDARYWDNRYEELSFVLVVSLYAIASRTPDLLEPLLNHANTKFRLDAADSFRHILDKRAIPALLDIMRNGEEPRDRSRAVDLVLPYGLSGSLDVDEKEMVISALKEALVDKYIEQGPKGRYRPVVCAAYRVLLMLDVEVEEPEDWKNRPKLHP